MLLSYVWCAWDVPKHKQFLDCCFSSISPQLSGVTAVFGEPVVVIDVTLLPSACSNCMCM